MNDFGPGEISAAELEAVLGDRFDPPAETRPATCALYAKFVLHRLNPNALPNLFLLGNGPPELLHLEESTMAMRREHSVSELKAMAKVEMQ